LYYANYVEKIPVIEFGNETSEWVLVYSEPIKRKLNISAGRGEAEIQMFGVNLDFSRVIGPDNINTPINIHSIIWIGVEPEIVDGKNITPHNHIVAGIADSKNIKMIAVKSVDVSL